MSPLSDTDVGGCGVQGGQAQLGQRNRQVAGALPSLLSPAVVCPVMWALHVVTDPSVLCNQRILPETGRDPTGEALWSLVRDPTERQVWGSASTCRGRTTHQVCVLGCRVLW